MRAVPVSLAVLMMAGVLAGCISDEAPPVDTTDEFVHDARASWTIPETITGMEEMYQMNFSLDDTELNMRTTGIWLHDDLLYTSGTGLAIVDVSDPEAPVTLSFLEDTASRDVDIMEHPNGYLYAVLAGSPGIIFVNVTDPREPVVTSNVTIGYHNIAVVPGTSLVYNSRSLYTGQSPVDPVETPAGTVAAPAGPDLVQRGGLVDIIDFASPEEPVVDAWRMGRYAATVDGAVRPVTAPACHDISVYSDFDRAYCAGVTETQVWDISEPRRPVILQVIHNPGTNIHHAAYANSDHTVLILGDELGGAALAPGCTVSDQPYGGVWFVDISDLKAPVPMGWWAPEEAHEDPVRVTVPDDPTSPGIPVGVRTCTAHFGNIVEDRDVLVMGFYTAGVFLIDFSDPADPVEIANYRPGGNVWEGQYYRGNVYTGDGSRGVDVLELVGDGEEVFPRGP